MNGTVSMDANAAIVDLNQPVTDVIDVMQQQMHVPQVHGMPVVILDNGIQLTPMHPMHTAKVTVPGVPISLQTSSSTSRWNNQCTYFAGIPCMLVMIFLLLNVMKRLPKEGNGLQASLWAAFGMCFVLALAFQPEAEDPSIVISFGAGFQMFSLALFWLLPRKASKPGAANGNGDSPAFAMLMMVVLSLRLPCILRFQGYLPTDQSGDGCYQLFELVTLILSIRGLARTGLTTRDGMYSAATLTFSALLALICYGDLDRRPAADRAVAASIYTEVCAWGFLVYATVSAGADRTITSGFLPPALVQACCRTYFWYLAAPEMEPLNPKLLMSYFPDAIVAAHFAMCGLIGLATILVCCPEKDALVTPMQSAANEQLNSVVDDAAGAFEMAKGGVEELAKGLVPIRAVWENGTMKVEYALPDAKTAKANA